ncbi:MAG: hypothetical protein HY922_16060 [Elusimicrobia bacterium]|nr:hypothetical protein [Elusimicrobiota bacterium]
MRLKRLALSLSVLVSCALSAYLAAAASRGKPLPVAQPSCNSEFQLENIHYMRGPNGELGCVGDVVAGAGSARSLEIASIRFDRIETATLADSTLYLNGSGSLMSYDPLSNLPTSEGSRLKRLSVILRSNADEEDPAAAGQPAQQIPHLASWYKPMARPRAPSKGRKISVSEQAWGTRAAAKRLSSCLFLAEQVQKAGGGARFQITSLRGYRTSRFAVVQYRSQAGAAVILNQTATMRSGDGLTCTADFPEK